MKHKVWDLERERWHPIETFISNAGELYDFEYDLELRDPVRFVVCYDSELKDEVGVSIYSNDIVTNGRCNYTVMIGNGMFCAELNHDCPTYELSLSDIQGTSTFKKIGNVFEYYNCKF